MSEELRNHQAFTGDTPAPHPGTPVTPTVSAWAISQAQAETPAAEAQEPRGRLLKAFDNIPLVVFAGFWILFLTLIFLLAWLVVAQGHRFDGDVAEVSKRLDRGLKEVERLQEKIDTTQATLAGDINRLRQILSDQGAEGKIATAQAAQNRQDITELRARQERILGLLNDLTYVRQPKIPVEEGQKP